jgi:tetratricopeptide (TPR) repeat protein
MEQAYWVISYPMRKLGKRHEALQYAQQSLKVRAMVGAYNAVGDAELDLNNRSAALEHYRLALVLAEKQVRQAPRNMQRRTELAATYEGLERYYETEKNLTSAREWYQKALEVWRDWPRFGESGPLNVRREQEAARMVARCEAALAKK